MGKWKEIICLEKYITLRPWEYEYVFLALKHIDPFQSANHAISAAVGSGLASVEQLMLAKDQYRSWSTLGFIRSLCVWPQFCKLMCSPAWIQLFFSIVEANSCEGSGGGGGLEANLPTQVILSENSRPNAWRSKISQVLTRYI